MSQDASHIIGPTELKQKYLPHRYPMLMIDRVTDYKEGEYIEGIKCVTANSPELLGHFPERAIMPATLILQSFAQLAIVFFKLTNGQLKPDELTLITSVKARFLKPVYPGDTIHLRLTPTRIAASTIMFDGDAKVDSASVVRSSLTLAKTAVENFAGAPW